MNADSVDEKLSRYQEKMWTWTADVSHAILKSIFGTRLEKKFQIPRLKQQNRIGIMTCCKTSRPSWGEVREEVIWQIFITLKTWIYSFVLNHLLNYFGRCPREGDEVWLRRDQGTEGRATLLAAASSCFLQQITTKHRSENYTCMRKSRLNMIIYYLKH